jgi:hypothetical protein
MLGSTRGNAPEEDEAAGGTTITEAAVLGGGRGTLCDDDDTAAVTAQWLLLLSLKDALFGAVAAAAGWSKPGDFRELLPYDVGGRGDDDDDEYS